MRSWTAITQVENIGEFQQPVIRKSSIQQNVISNNSKTQNICVANMDRQINAFNKIVRLNLRYTHIMKQGLIIEKMKQGHTAYGKAIYYITLQNRVCRWLQNLRRGTDLACNFATTIIRILLAIQSILQTSNNISTVQTPDTVLVKWKLWSPHPQGD
jgi:hypothetical protein